MTTAFILAPTSPPLQQVNCRPCMVSAAVQPSITSITYAAGDLAAAYSFPAYDASAVSVIGVLSFGGGLHGTVDATTSVLTNGDVQHYWSSVSGIAAADMPTVIVKTFLNATNDVSDASSTLENTMDVTIIGACRPGAGTVIILYILPNGIGLTKAFQLLFTTPVRIADGVTVVPTLFSVSWGHDETAILKTDAQACNAVLASAAAAGINVCVASGDSGSNGGTCDWPAASPNVIACGGTSLYCPSTPKVYDAATVEYAWSDGGGGTSAYFPMPTYQVGTAPAAVNRRCVPDVALNADPQTGVRVLVNGKTWTVGGTSAAAPLFAAYLARTQPPNYVNPALYGATRAAFNDVLLGSNGLYAAMVGYDKCTGMGSINGSALATTLATSSPRAMTIREPLVGLVVGKTFTLTTSPSQDTVGDVATATAWQSSNPHVVSVTSAGVVAAISSGTATITASRTTVTDGLPVTTTATKTIVVTAAPVLPPALPVPPVPAPNRAPIYVTSVRLNKTAPFRLAISARTTLAATILPANATIKTVVWSSSNPRVATVTSAGVVTAVKPGTTIIKVTANGSAPTSIKKSDTVTVIVNLPSRVVIGMRGLFLHKGYV